jgi:nicotinate-nucleotide adenylyltransferase
MRIGVFGGSFDPVHLGHLVMAELCREQAGLDEVRFIPAARPPHKQHQTQTPFHVRVEMLALAISGNAAFRIDELEKDRPGPSFTADTLDLLHAREPDAELCLILGADSVVDLPLWYDPHRIVARATLLVIGRPGWQMPDPESLRAALQLTDDEPLRLQAVECPLIEIASRELRQRVAEGKTIRYQTPRSVEAYIAQHGLYKT